MSVNSVINAYLSAYAGLTTLVPAARILTQQAGQNTARPYVVHFVVSDVHDQTHSGRSGCRTVDIQASCYGSTLASAEAVAAQVILGLGTWATSDGDVDAAKDFVTRNLSEDDTGLFHVVVEATILYRGS